MIRLRKKCVSKAAEKTVKNIFSLLYIDEDGNFDPDKEWDSAADYLQEIAEMINCVTEWVPDKKSKKD